MINTISLTPQDLLLLTHTIIQQLQQIIKITIKG